MQSPKHAAVLRRNLALVALWLAIINLFALLALNRLNVHIDTAFEWMSPAYFTPKQSWNLIELRNRWDSYWFLDVAQHGYYLRGENRQANVAFFPLYPLLIRAVGLLTGGNLALAGWIVSSLCLVLAATILTRYVQRFHPGIDPTWVLAFLLAYPTAFQFNAIYSESLFLCLSLGMFYYALQGRFLAAALCAAMASFTRLAGIFLTVPLLVEFVQARGWRALLSWRIWPLALAPVGALAFFTYHWIAFDDFFLYLKVENWWGRDFVTSIRDYTAHTPADIVNTILELSHAVLAVVLGLVALRRLRPSYGLYMLVSLGIALGSGTTFAIARYAMVLFPIYLVAGSMASIVAKSAWLLTSMLLLALDTILFVNHYWAG